MSHTVRTPHIQRLIDNGLSLAIAVDGAAGTHVKVPASAMQPDLTCEVYVIDVLEKAAADLRHAAEELEAERLSCLGWRQA
jgi:hypothetical protein